MKEFKYFASFASFHDVGNMSCEGENQINVPLVVLWQFVEGAVPEGKTFDIPVDLHSYIPSSLVQELWVVTNGSFKCRSFVLKGSTLDQETPIGLPFKVLRGGSKLEETVNALEILHIPHGLVTPRDASEEAERHGEVDARATLFILLPL